MHRSKFYKRYLIKNSTSRCVFGKTQLKKLFTTKETHTTRRPYSKSFRDGLSLLNIDLGDSSVHSGTNFGGENQSGTAFAVRTIVKKGEDRFLACEDLRALFVEDDDELLVLPTPKPASITATFSSCSMGTWITPRLVFASKDGWSI